jgi:hypothetical protein
MHAMKKNAPTHPVAAVVVAVAMAMATAAPIAAAVSEARVGPARIAAGLFRAHVARADSRVGINYGKQKPRFFGKVRSKARVCRGDRVVRIIEARRRISDVLVGTARTGRFGGWKLRRPQASGRFYARVIRKIRTPYGHFHRCRPDSSPVIKVR